MADDFVPFDEFELGLLAVARHLVLSFSEPERQSWQVAFRIAEERWGETLGLAATHLTLKLVRAVLRTRSATFACHDPQDLEARAHMTGDEQSLLRMVHYMRRDQTAPARDALAVLTHGHMDPDVIRAGLGLAARFAKGATGVRAVAPRPILRAVG